MTINLWRFTDSKAGHETQTRGLCYALNELESCASYDIPASTCNNNLLNLLGRRFPAGNALPRPDLIIGAGHQTHVPMLAAARATQGKTVLMMKPSLPLRLFDFCLIPEHDGRISGKNIIRTKGAINDIQYNPEKTKSVLILVGGPSRHMQWAGISEQIIQLLEYYSDWQINIADSPRTPSTFWSELNTLDGVKFERHFHADLPRHQLINMLEIANHIWVSMDSISMVYEALTAGAAVGLLELEAANTNRVFQLMQNLIREGKVTAFHDWQRSHAFSVSKNFNEAKRCAQIICKKALSNNT